MNNRAPTQATRLSGGKAFHKVRNRLDEKMCGITKSNTGKSGDRTADGSDVMFPRAL